MRGWRSKTSCQEQSGRPRLLTDEGKHFPGYVYEEISHVAEEDLELRRAVQPTALPGDSGDFRDTTAPQTGPEVGSTVLAGRKCSASL
jgi:hypothetical protein